MPYRDILMLAAKREEKSLALYNLLLTKAESEAVREVFKVLCQEEASTNFSEGALALAVWLIGRLRTAMQILHVLPFHYNYVDLCQTLTQGELS